MNDQMSWFEGGDDKKFEELPEGQYSATLTNVTLNETKEFPSISIEFTLANKRKDWLNLTFKETMKWKVSQTMKDLGISERAKSFVKAGKPITHAILDAAGELIGSVCEIDIEYSEWKGKRYKNCKVLSISGAIATPAVRQAAPSAAARPAVKNHAPKAPAPSFNSDDEMPDFMR